MKKLTVIIILLLSLTFLFGFMPATQEKDQPLTTALYKTNMKIIDIRTEPEWSSTGIVKGSYTITFFDEKGRYDIDKFTKQLNRIVNSKETFAIICRTGNRTTSVAKLLRRLGYTGVINLKGGVVQAHKNNVPFAPYIKK